MTRKYNRQKLLLGVTAVMLAATPVYSTSYAATTQNSAPHITAVSNVVKPVYISANSFIKLVDVNLTPADNGQLAAFTVSISNGSTSELDLSDYWFRLANSAGSSYTLKSSSDSKTTKVSPNSKAIIT